MKEAIHSPVIIGIDLDNTLVSYDAVMREIAFEEGFLSQGLNASELSKRGLRDHLRSQQNGEAWWQQIQSLAYGKYMSKATLMPGVHYFLSECARLRRFGMDITLYIISHKTRLANNYSDGTDFHQSAMAFLTDQNIFSTETGLTPDRLFFEPSRSDKVKRIAELKCTHFVDDLEETFCDPEFPIGVQRFLYDPFEDGKDLAGVCREASWEQITWKLLSLEPDWHALAGETVSNIQQIHGGRNARMYRLTTVSGHVLAGKHYYQHHQDRRNRLENEWNAFDLLHRAGVETVPVPVAKDIRQNTALYSFCEGNKATDTPASLADMDACLAFLDLLQKVAKVLPQEMVSAIPKASEACFSLAEIETNLRSRFESLMKVSTADVLGKQLSQFLLQELEPFLDKKLNTAQKQLPSKNDPLPLSQRMLSPSDFGLHNAIRNRDSLTFVDFEYFGWDDPAKTLCDFILHPAMALADEMAAYFARNFLKQFARYGISENDLAVRAASVYPLYGIKWCPILLNEFLHTENSRRAFATLQHDNGGDSDTCRTVQLEKARKMLTTLKSDRDEWFNDLR